MIERKDTVLIIDAGGRAAALADAYSKSPNVGTVLVAPGNDLIKFNCQKPVETFPKIGTKDVDSIVQLATERCFISRCSSRQRCGKRGCQQIRTGKYFNFRPNQRSRTSRMG